MKTAIVTGAARGIGLAIAKKLMAEGYWVAMLDINGDGLETASSKLLSVSHSASTGRQDGVDALAQARSSPPLDERLGNQAANHQTYLCDIRDLDVVKSTVEAVNRETGRVDALVNNAGIATFMPFTETSYEDWSDILAVNLHGPFLCSQACIPYMLTTGGGSIVNITSISGVRASTLRTAYGTSKAALAHLTKQMAAELGTQGIRVNAVAPGPVETAMASKVHTPEIRRDYHDAIPLGRYGLEEEIANVVAFLCGEASAYVNGQEIAVDGGFESTGIGLSTLRAD